MQLNDPDRSEKVGELQPVDPEVRLGDTALPDDILFKSELPRALDRKLSIHHNGYHGTDEQIPTILNNTTNAAPDLVGLLSKFFDGKITKNQRAQLAGQLVFPANERAAQLFKRHVLGNSNETIERELTAFALSPLNERGAELQYERLKGVKLGAVELAEVYGSQVHPRNSSAAMALAERVEELLVSLDADPPAKEERQRIVVEFARAELEATKEWATPIDQLAELFNLSAASVRSALRNEQHGLTAAEIHQREERVSIVTESQRFALEMQVRTGVRSFVHLENEMHRSGVVKTLSSRKELAELFGISHNEIRKAVQLLPGEDRRYRDRVLGKEDPVTVKNSIVSEVRRESSEIRSGTKTEFRDDAELAKRYGVLPITVARALRDELSESDWSQREYLLNRQGNTEKHRSSVVAYAKAEMEAFDKGEISSLSRISKLAKVFNISEELVETRFRDPDTGLSLAERKFRRYVFKNQFAEGPAKTALRDVNVMQLKEAVERKSQEGKAKPSSEGSTGLETIEKRSSRSVVFNGHRHDSYEEAVCGVLLEKYIPGFSLKEGDTFQIPLAGNRRADFRVDGTVVEWHPILLFKTKEGVGSFASFDELKEYQRIKGQLNDSKAKLFEAETRQRLADRYYDERKEAIDSTTGQRGRELVVVDSPRAFYHAVIARFGKDVPSEQRFVREFNKVKARVKREVLENR